MIWTHLLMHQLLLFTALFATVTAFAPPHRLKNHYERATLLMITPATTASQDIASSEPKSKPRSGFAQQLLNLALTSPLWDYVLVPQARASIVKTAEGTKICIH